MSPRGSFASYNKLQNFLQFFNRYRSFSMYNSEGQLPPVTVPKPQHGYCSMNQGLLLISSNGRSFRKQDTNLANADMVNKVHNPAAAATPPPPKFNFTLWAKWLLGSIISILLPFWKQKWDKLKQIEGEAEMVVEEAEIVAEVVENVATVAENVSAKVADILPDHTKLKDAVLFVEQVSKETAHDAQLTQNFFHKVDELNKDLIDLETMVESVVAKIAKHESKEASKKNS